MSGKKSLCLAIPFILIFTVMAWGRDNMLLDIKVGDSVIKGELENNPVTLQLQKMCPMTLAMEDFNHAEKIGMPPRKLDSSQAAHGFKPVKGDIGLYAPWGNICVFYEDASYSKGLVYLGRITSGLDELARQDGDFQAAWSIK